MRSSKIVFCLMLLILASCGTDLAPSGTDQRPQVQCGITGPHVCQLAPDFTLPGTQISSVSLSSTLSSTSGVVIYFTTWCTICRGEMINMRDTVMQAYPNVAFFVVDFVSGSVATASKEESDGFAGSGFIVLVDTNEYVTNLYKASMGTTVVVDRNGVIKMNELYKSAKLQNVLAGLP